MRDSGGGQGVDAPAAGSALPASRRTEAPPVSPATSQDAGRDGWLSDLLNRTDASGAGGRDAPRGRSPQGAVNPLELLSLDIARLMDRNLAAEMSRSQSPADDTSAPT